MQICHQMWSDDDGPYEGRHYRLAETICSPRPISRPRPTILVGGSGERKTLRLVARYADACNLFAPDPEVVAHKLEVLARHCDAESRDPADIEKTILGFADPLDGRRRVHLVHGGVRRARDRTGRTHADRAPIRPGGWASSGNRWSRSSPRSIRPASSTALTTPDGEPGATP